MHLGLVGPQPPPNGGMAMQTLQLARLLEEEGVHVDLVQTNAPYRPAVMGKVKGLRAVVRLLPYLWRIWRLAGRADVIHLMANSGWSWQLFAAPVIWIGWVRRTPVIVNYRGGEARQYLQASAAWVKPSMRKAASIVVPSGFLRDVFKEFELPAMIISNIIDLDTFYPALEPPSEAPFTLVITRNLESIYGIDTAIQALAVVRQTIAHVQLKIAGNGPLAGKLKQLVDELGLSDNVVFLGRLDRGEIVALYHSAHAMLNPSRVDNMPNSILEALACGLPVISTNVGGVPYIVEDTRTALLVPPDDVQSMAQAISRLCNDPSLRTQLRENGCQAVAQYAWPEVRPQWLALYESCRVAA
ncbi:MAG: glycosyltransferase family 4 protein [Halioglobus sp.]